MVKLFSTGKHRYILLVCALFLVVSSIRAQVVHSYGVSYHAGKVWAHSKYVQNTAHDDVTMIQLDYDKYLTDTGSWNTFGLFPHHGWIMNYTNYNSQVLGRALVAAYYIQPTMRIGRRFEWGFRATFGAAIASSPFDLTSHRENYSYSLWFNPHLVLGLNASFHLSKQLTFWSTVQLNHISNASVRKPNSGVNWPTAGIGVRYRMQDYLPPGMNTHQRPSDVKKLRLDASVYYARAMYSIDERMILPIYGAQLLGSWYGRLHGWTLATEITKDAIYDRLITNNGIPVDKPVLMAALFGHEFVFKRFIFSQQLGRYYVQQGDYYPSKIFHRWGLTFYPHRNFGVGFNLKVHIEQANLVDWRLIYSFNR